MIVFSKISFGGNTLDFADMWFPPEGNKDIRIAQMLDSTFPISSKILFEKSPQMTN